MADPWLLHRRLDSSDHEVYSAFIRPRLWKLHSDQLLVRKEVLAFLAGCGAGFQMYQEIVAVTLANETLARNGATQ